MKDIDWLDALPFQREIVHSSVLRFLLNQDSAGDRQKVVQFVRELTGEQTVDSVLNPFLEQRLAPGSRLDLVADLNLADGTATNLAVEMKVDSAWDWQQLIKSAPSSAVAVLIAVGLTHLTVRQQELDLLKKENSESANWVVVGPCDLADAIDNNFKPAAGSYLGRYVDCLRAEAHDHEEAMNDLTANSAVSDRVLLTNGARDDANDIGALQMTAYLANCLKGLDKETNPIWRWSHPPSGPAIIRGFETYSHGTETKWLSWLEINGNYKAPQLTVKVGRSGAGIRQDRERVVAKLSAAGITSGSANERRLSESRKTATAWTIPMVDYKPYEITELIKNVDTCLDAETLS